MSNSLNDEVQQIKEKGNECVRNNEFGVALHHYTQAIQLEPNNYSLYSNRSLAFLKLKLYYQAYEDACEAIRLKPDWPKGYYRKGEVLTATYQFSEALLTYKIALQFLPHDPLLLEAIRNVTILMCKEKRVNQQVPWVGSGIGLILGVLIVLSDQLLTAKPTITHPILMVLVVITIGLLGFAGGKTYINLIMYSRKGMLDPPVDLLKEMRKQNVSTNGYANEKSHEKFQRHTKAHSRLKLRKSKV